MENESVIRIEHVTKKYNLYSKPQDRFKEAIGLGKGKLHSDFYALNDITFDVKKGETVGIIGTNGSGKSTLLKIITGVLKATEGTTQVNGKVSALLELGAGFNQEYTGMENIFLNGRMMGYSRKEMEERVDSIVEFADIGEFIDQPVKNYSSGMFARLAFAVAINVEPDILIVDEALSVGDLFFQNKCFRKFEELKEKDVTILFVSHDISSVRQMCSRVLWIERGVQKIFDQSDMVCDMYMDMKRQKMNEAQKNVKHDDAVYLDAEVMANKVTFPPISWNETALESDRVKVRSIFITDSEGNVQNYMEVDKRYSYHVVVEPLEDIDEMIVGLVAENNKGIPLFDFNNYMNSGKVVKGVKGKLLEVVFHFTLPRLMKGEYVIAATVARGNQEEHEQLCWLHGSSHIEIINNGYNSGYIEVPAGVTCMSHEIEDVRFEEM